MKRSFSGYYKDVDIEQVLKDNDAIIVIDPVVLCNLYGFHDEVWKTVISIIEKKKELLWLPYNLALAYHRGIVPVIIQKIQLLITIKNRLRQSSDFLSTLPFDLPIIPEYEEISGDLSRHLTKEIAILKQRGKKDSEIRESIASLYKGRIGEPNNDPDPQSFKIKTYSEITEADAITGQCTDSISHSNANVNGLNVEENSNDVILHTLIQLSKDKHKDILYIISEPSRYWSVFIGKTSFGPNPEHQTYFMKNSDNHNLFCYPFASFMTHLSNSLDIRIQSEVYSSIKRLSYGSMLLNNDDKSQY